MTTINVRGEPGPQGSKRHVGGGRMIESSKLVKPWREAVEWAIAEQAAGKHYAGPVAVTITFFLARPSSAPKRITRPAKKPDLDKLMRSTFDALTKSGLIVDDARIVAVSAVKLFGQPGALITVEEVDA